MEERIQNVAVRGSIPAKDAAEQGDKCPQVRKVKGAPSAIPWLPEVENQQLAAWLKNAKEFGDALAQVCEIAETIADRNEFK